MLPYEIVIPNTLFEEELLKFSEQEKISLLDDGLKVLDLPGAGVLRAIKIESDFPALSIHDCFAFALAESIQDSILLRGDGLLRTVASNIKLKFMACYGQLMKYTKRKRQKSVNY